MSKGKLPPRLPGDASVAEIAHANLRRQQRARGNAPRTVSGTGPEAQALVRESLKVENPPDRSESLSREMEGIIQLRVEDVQPYDRNPRRHENERYQDIKNSIRAANVLAPIVVTKRPGTSTFMVAAGGNTRLRAQQELWAETGDPRFEHLLGMYRPWVSELQTMLSHLAENELRGNMSFWDRACGMAELKAEVEAAEGKTLSLRQLRGNIEARGLRVSITMLSFFGFAAEQLGALGPATVRLSHSVVQALQPAMTQLQRYMQLHDEEAAWSRVRDQALKAQAQALLQDAKAQVEDEVEEIKRVAPLDADRLILALERAVAAHLNHNLKALQTLRGAIERKPKASLAELRADLHEEARAAARSSSASAGMARPSAANKHGTGAVDDPPALPGPPNGPADGTLYAGTYDQTLADFERPERPHAVQRDNETSDAAGDSDAAEESVGLALEDEDGEREAPIIEFVRACGTADLYRECPALPHGYFMEIPPDGAFIDGFNTGEVTPMRHVGWWIAATFSGQIDGEHSHLMPEASLWRQAQRQENGHDELSLQWHIETTLGHPPELRELAGWLVSCPAHVLEAYDRLIQAMRDARGMEGEP